MKGGFDVNTVKKGRAIYDLPGVLSYCEKRGIYEVHSRIGNVITYYSYYPGEGVYRVEANIKTEKEKRKLLNNSYLYSESENPTYNYAVG